MRQVAALHRALPSAALREKGWRLAYSLTRDGASSATLLAACASHATHLLVVEDSWGYVFGASFSHALSEHAGPSYYGTGESWLFSFLNRPADQLATVRRRFAPPCAAQRLL